MILNDVPATAKVWLYQSDRAFTSAEKITITQKLTDFINEWAAHGTKLKASAELVGDFHVVLAVDESVYGASGCSIDASVRFIKSLGEQFGIDFFNRMNFLVESTNGLKLVHFSELKNYPDAYFYQPLVHSLGDLRTNWRIKVLDRKF
ncbi:MAG: ABC transporter ATPase [Fluviicola sp.]|nr:ABC transporter ATPase [Fluviicola sp.]MBP6271774.1 ABC transporter ATPase [Fluviicola sp.]